MICCCRLLYVGMTGSREIRVYTILDDGTLSFNNVSYFLYIGGIHNKN